MRFTAIAFMTALCFLTVNVAVAETDLEREREIAEQVPLQIQRIPHVIPTADELANPELYRPHNDWVYTPPAADTLPPPPEDAVLRPGEFDEMDSTIIAIINQSPAAAYQPMWADMMEAFQHGGHTYVVFSPNTLSLQNAMTNHFDGRGIDPESYTYLEYPIDSIWIRDYGPEFGLEEDGTRFIFDADYSSRPNDDVVPIAMANDDWINEDGSPVPYYSTDHRLSGGNIMSDGNGTCFFSTIVYGYEEKPSGWTDANVDSLMRDYLGCEQIIILNPICLDMTGHIDLYAKILTETSILLSEFPSDTHFTGTVDSGESYGHCNDPQFPNDYQDQEDNLAILEASTNLDGDAWQITRLPMLEPYQYGGGWVYRSHMNSQIFNGHVAMPSYYVAQIAGETAADLLDAEAAAIAAYEEAAPGITVHPIDADHIINSGGAMHCISHEIPAARPWAGWPEPVVDAGVDSGADTGGDDGCGCNALGNDSAPASLLSILL